ncbi:MAG TPA: sulfotransferase [Candidatus Atribacteria bacterium]|nr:sulfotransferase [Candidatus Atribacteria bacterium]
MHIIHESLNKIYYYWKRNNWLIDPRTYFGNYADIPIYKPIFLLGPHCGGLTLVSRMLRRHPSVVSCTGNYHYWAGADEMHTVLGPILPAELTGIRYKAPYPNHPIFHPPKLRSWTYACDELLPFYRKTAKDATPALKIKFQRIIRMIIGKYAINKYHARFTDKSQVYTVRVSLINELLKEYNPKFILVVMNPYALCYKAAIGIAADMAHLKNKLPLEKRLEICSEHWANSMNCALEDKEKDKNIDMLIIRFEDILFDPITNMKKICEFVELDFNKDMIPQPHHKIPLGTDPRDEGKWYPLRPNMDKNYLEKLGRKEIEIISEKCKNLALRFGYEVPQ